MSAYIKCSIEKFMCLMLQVGVVSVLGVGLGGGGRGLTTSNPLWPGHV